MIGKSGLTGSVSFASNSSDCTLSSPNTSCQEVQTNTSLVQQKAHGATVNKGDVLVDSIGQLPQIAVLLVSILMVAFFSSSEASLISVNKFRIRHLAEQGNTQAQAVNSVVHNHEKFFATILFTENAFIILASSMGTAMAFSIFGESGIIVLLTTLVLTVFIVAFGEITPSPWQPRQQNGGLSLWPDSLRSS